MPVDLTPAAIDALIERLNDVALEKQQAAWADRSGGQDYSIGAMLAQEAADTIAALRAAPVAMRERAAQVALEQAALSKKHADQADEVGHDTTADQMRMEAEVAAAIAQAIRALPLDAPAPVDPVAEAAPCDPLSIVYTNWRGETAERKIIPISVWYGKTEWHPEDQWFLKASDVEKNGLRDFAMRDIGTIATEPAANLPPTLAAALALPEVKALVEAVQKLRLRETVAGWNGEGLSAPYTPHPPEQAAGIMTTCGVVYEIDAALSALRAASEKETRHDRP